MNLFKNDIEQSIARQTKKQGQYRETILEGKHKGTFLLGNVVQRLILTESCGHEEWTQGDVFVGTLDLEQTIVKRSKTVGIKSFFNNGNLLLIKPKLFFGFVPFVGQAYFVATYREEDGQTVIKGKIGTPPAFYKLCAGAFIIIGSLYFFLTCLESGNPLVSIQQLLLLAVCGIGLVKVYVWFCTVLFPKKNKEVVDFMESIILDFQGANGGGS